MRGVLFDLPEVVAGAPSTLEAAGVSDRCEVVAGDFFTSIPTGGDAYLLRQVVHDWDDDQAARILENCRRALGGQGRVLVVERAIVPDYHQAVSLLRLDLEMLVNFGGRQRTEAEYGTLFAAAGLRLSAAFLLLDKAQFSVFEGVPT